MRPLTSTALERVLRESRDDAENEIDTFCEYGPLSRYSKLMEDFGATAGSIRSQMTA